MQRRRKFSGRRLGGVAGRVVQGRAQAQFDRLIEKYPERMLG